MLIAAAILFAHRSTLNVGDGKPFSRIEDAVKAAQPGDEIRVYPKVGGYKGAAVVISTSGLKISGDTRIVIDGAGFEYSGIGQVPRAIFQVNPEADGVTISNFELKGAHNGSHNGSGIRINGASRCTVQDCLIHENDMGIMSNGVVGDLHAASKQLIDHCEIYRNGDFADPGFNHNLYLGGTSVTVQFCDIHDSLTGHNLKSRAHYITVQYCSIHDSSNRELDFVDAWDTDRPNSNVLLLGNIIRKNPDAKGNRTVINFGIERGRRDGTIFLVNNEISTDFMSPVVALTGPNVTARFVNNLVDNLSQSHPVLVGVENGAILSRVSGNSNVLSPNYDVSGTAIDTQTLYADPHLSERLAGHPHRALTFLPSKASYVDGAGTRHEVKPTYRATDRTGWITTHDSFIGAG